MIELADLPDSLWLCVQALCCAERDCEDTSEISHHFGCTVTTPGRFGSSIHDPIARLRAISLYFAIFWRSSSTPNPGPCGTAMAPSTYGNLPPTKMSSVRW